MPRYTTKARKVLPRAAAICLAMSTPAAHAAAARGASPVALLMNETSVPALGITADGAAALSIAVQQTTRPSTATLTVTNEATLVPYDSNYRNTPPASGSTTLTVSGSQIVETKSGIYVLALLQAPDILKAGPGGGIPDLTQPITVTITLDGNAQPAQQITLYPPPVMLVHGLWGTETSLAHVETYLSKTAPWQNLPAPFLTAIQYENDAAFDSTGISDVVDSSLQKIDNALTDASIAAGRVDIVAHSMGGLVARHYSALPNYTGPANRTLGAFHHVVTINTPETGSLLATFLLDNATLPFSKKAGLLAKAVKFAACPDAKSVQGCFAEQNDNLAPPGKPLDQGAIYSLQPASPNIAALPPANIPNAPWHALSSTVGQSDSLLVYPNALVFELDYLIAATCPGPTYCPTQYSPPPKVGTIMNTTVNDGIVPLASQIAGANNPITLPHLAHTHGGGENDLSEWVLSFANVLSSIPANEQVGCWLANTTCPPLPELDNEVAADLRAPWPGFDATRPWRVVDRLSHQAPAQAAIGTPFLLPVRFPAGRIASISVRQSDPANAPVPAYTAPIIAAPDGTGLAQITPLATGDVRFRVHAVFTDYAASDYAFTVHVGPPAQAPLGFWADDMLRQLGGAMTLHLAPGQRSVLQPVAAFTGAPAQTVWLRGGVTFHANNDVAAVSADGVVTARHPGSASVSVALGKYAAVVNVDVK